MNVASLSTQKSLLLSLLILALHQYNSVVSAADPDKHDDCKYWAEHGECDTNPNYMLANCATSCETKPDENESCGVWAENGECTSNPGYMLASCAASCAKTRRLEAATLNELKSISSIYDLSATDIHGNKIDFESFRGQVVIIVNVASFCGFTDSHYKGLVELWSNLKAKDERVQILAFPCNQFGAQEPHSNENINEFATTNYGVTFTMMDKVNVNGPDASLLFKYLKHNTAVPQITWNFATYFMISPKGDIRAFNGVEPKDLFNHALGQLQQHDEL